jgi:hypothetical protein
MILPLSKCFFAYFTGVAFIAAGVSMLVNVYARLAAILLGLMFLLGAVFLHGLRVAAALQNALAFSGFAFIIAATSPSKS